MGFFTKKVASPAVVLLVAIIAAVATFAACGLPYPYSALTEADSVISQSVTPEQLYAEAVRDAITIEPDELFGLIDLFDGSDFSTWKDGRVLLLTWHRYPDSYIPGGDYTLKYGEVWAFTDREIIRWYKEHKPNIPDIDIRLRQLIGLPPDKAYTHFTALWVDPDDILRPAYVWQLSETIGSDRFEQEPSEDYKRWFDGNIIWSYFDSAYPWTRLGYTYDWSEGSREYGLSEFLIRKDAITKVEFTLSTEEFVSWMDRQE